MQKTVTISKPFLEYPQTRKKKITALKAKQLSLSNTIQLPANYTD